MKDDIDFRTRFSKKLEMFQLEYAYGTQSPEPLRDVRRCMMHMDQMDMPSEEKSILAVQTMQALVTDRIKPLPKTLLRLYCATVLNGVDTVIRHSATPDAAHTHIAQVAQACMNGGG